MIEDNRSDQDLAPVIRGGALRRLIDLVVQTQKHSQALIEQMRNDEFHNEELIAEATRQAKIKLASLPGAL
jgi:hypothetical protein